MNKSELVEIALKLKNNVDEAEQLSDHIDNLIKHCDKSFLLYFIECMADNVEYNLIGHRSARENVNDDPDELRDLIKFVREKL